MSGDVGRVGEGVGNGKWLPANLQKDAELAVLHSGPLRRGQNSQLRPLDIVATDPSV